MTDVIIIGGGASGMLAALTAAESGHSVLLLERQSRVGRKLLATGNGRCNLTNHHAAPDAAILCLAGTADGQRGQRAGLSHE